MYLASGVTGALQIAAVVGSPGQPSPMLVVESGVPGISFSLQWSSGSGAVNAGGVYAGPSAVRTVSLRFDGPGGTVLGGTLHEAVCVSSSSLFSVLSQLAIGGREGVAIDAPLATLSHPDDIDVQASLVTPAFGLELDWQWVRGSPSSGTLRLRGTPTSHGQSVVIVQYTWAGLVIGQSSHPVAIGQFAAAPAPAPIPAPAPAAPPTLPLPPDARPSSIQLTDKHAHLVVALLDGEPPSDIKRSLPIDVAEQNVRWQQAVIPVLRQVGGTNAFGVYPTDAEGRVGFGFVSGAEGTGLASARPPFILLDYPILIPDLMVEEGEFTVEAFLRPGPAMASLWQPGPTRWVPVVSGVRNMIQGGASSAGAANGWSLGLLSITDRRMGSVGVRPAIVCSVHHRSLIPGIKAAYSKWFGLNPAHPARLGLAVGVGQLAPPPAGRWMHLAGQVHAAGGAHHVAAWLDGAGGGLVDRLDPAHFFGGHPLQKLVLIAGQHWQQLLSTDGAEHQAPELVREAGLGSAVITAFSGGITSVRLTRYARYPRSIGSTGSFRSDLFPISWPRP